MKNLEFHISMPFLITNYHFSKIHMDPFEWTPAWVCSLFSELTPAWVCWTPAWVCSLLFRVNPCVGLFLLLPAWGVCFFGWGPLRDFFLRYRWTPSRWTCREWTCRDGLVRGTPCMGRLSYSTFSFFFDPTLLEIYFLFS